MENNRMLLISAAGTRKTKHWPRSEMLWSEFTERLRTPARSTETLEEYLAYAKQRQDDLKDVGGFVGGTFANDIRKAAYVEGRDLLTLDLDNIPAGGTEDVLKRVCGLGCAAAVYSTRKHAGYAPRLRVIVPLDRTATADEYEPAARKLAGLIGIEFCDPTTFDVARLMYWPSCCRDSEYVCEAYDRPFCSLDGLLGMYGDWTDISQWPQVPGAEAVERRRLARQEDPTAKRGVIGAFCRTYTITQAMEKFIPGMYEETAAPGRYTYTGGSTVGGAVVYDGDMFLYSHHATDPCSGLLVNAFDLVRLHMYGERDREAKEGTPANKLPSFVAMSRMAREDAAVSELLAKERLERAQQAFGDDTPDEDGPGLEWIKRLTVDGNGKIEKTINNAVIVLENDPLLKGKIVTDEFASCGIVLGKLPWSHEDEKRRWKDADDASFYNYMELFYGITGREKLDNALLIVSNQNRINDVKEYLKSLKWDGTRRVDMLLPDYLGAEDSPYTRAVMRKSLCAAVARAVTGGVKYDYMPIFSGPQGIGKSTLLAILGGAWFSDSLTTFEGKEAAELIQGTWINEIGELSAFTKQETQVIKQFLSKTHDIYRAAYGRRTEKYPRRCVFFGTSNDSDFLKDSTGNRRFWPVDVGIHPAKKSVWEELPKEVDQVWAEAYMYWQLGERLFLPKEIERMAEEMQEGHREASGKEGMIRDFLEREIPSDWNNYDLQQRRQFWNGNLKLPDHTELVKRDKVCAMEVWAECFSGDPRYLKRTDSMEINSALQAIKGWKRNKDKRRYGPYGPQRGFEKVNPI
ncbi:virulence-associated E family protein [[Clostridium] scindens]|uniref:virulence-associated E family protein n=1 Tax=Clostridium scindens (strain JCM 10418 / VPI 12708) TaxID=29347 RepID=UPI001570B731|nr:virulence-associated E family protein [[Clostridium] scindens]MCO7171556.1 virulence-associated E family protein [[Clostridium] scindens]NSJ13505.1 virulence-associated protein E [[Clostridium] scindens]DAL41807.1 MAG TPA_asm: virulence associated protein E [Caudoviricetes sp.]